MRLNQLVLHNFKGIRDFKLEPHGEPIDVYGDNATGKTTLSDAFHWLLFDKDSTGAKDFAIKTTTPDGEAIHNLDHSVKASLDIGGNSPLVLEKVYRETWTKKRGSATSSFTGHTTDYFVDGVPVPLKDYKARIAELGDEDTIRLITNPEAFNELHWQDRRRILIEVCGDVEDSEVIASSKKLARLPKLLGDRSLDDERKVLAARRKEINAELERIPVRIAEVERGLPTKPEGDVRELVAIDAEIADLREQVARIEAGGEVAEATKRKREIEAELLSLDNADREAVNAARAQADAASSEKRREASAARDRLRELTAERDRTLRTIEENAGEIARKRERMEKLRGQWADVDSEKFAYAHEAAEETCPTCGQQLPLAKLEEAVKKAEADFNRAKATRLEAITEEGRAVKLGADELSGETEMLRHEAETLAESIEKQQALADELATSAEETPTVEVELPVNPLRASAVKALAAIDAEIEALSADSGPKLEELNAQVMALLDKRRMAEQAARDTDVIEKGNARIVELAADEKRLAAEFEQLEADLFLTEEFVRAKVELLESRINARFSLARFRLFETQINGGLAECCECLVGGVPFSSGLNHGAQLAAGLDIIKTLSEFYGLSAPVFLDNAEAITEIPEIGAQIIALYVSEPDKALRIERKAS